MSFLTRLQGRIGQHTLLLTTVAVLLTGLLRRDSSTARARRLLARRDDVAVVMVDQDHFKAVHDGFGRPAGDAHTPVVLEDGRTVDVAASVGASATGVLGTRDLTALQRTADAVLYDGKHSGRAYLATAAHATLPSINGRGRAA
ncbi:hypothetical protein ACIRU8_44405 [Streptomyces sp. NPDC101175]|uniref:hypothetical protein n=1 Tax=Streptomyces sp. NPDC101175 TaxID=3366123 RepID=UPI0038337C9E